MNEAHSSPIDKSNGDQLADLRLLALYTRQFSLLINVGLSLVRTFTTIIEDSPAPFSGTLGEILAKLKQGHTLSSSLRDHPRYFSEFYVRMNRLGEVAGILDETTEDMALLMNEIWEYAELLEPGEKRFFLGLGLGSRFADWADLSAPGQQVCALLFCRSLNRLLSMGAPLPLSLEIVAELMPEKQREELRHIAHSESGSLVEEQLQQVKALPLLVSHLIEVGQKNGSLRLTMDQGAQYYRQALLVNAAPPALVYHTQSRAGANSKTSQSLSESWEYAKLVSQIDPARLQQEIDFYTSELVKTGDPEAAWPGDTSMNALCWQIVWLALRTDSTLVSIGPVDVEGTLSTNVVMGGFGGETVRRMPGSFLEPIALCYMGICSMNASERAKPQAGTAHAGVAHSWNRHSNHGKQSSFHFSYFPGELGPVILLRVASES